MGKTTQSVRPVQAPPTRFTNARRAAGTVAAANANGQGQALRNARQRQQTRANRARRQQAARTLGVRRVG